MRGYVIGVTVVALGTTLIAATGWERRNAGPFGGDTVRAVAEPTDESPAGDLSASSSTSEAAASARPRGTDAWKLRRPALARQIEGFASRTSIPPGARLQLKVSTSAARFRAVAYRFGDYRGGWATVVWRSGWRDGDRQRAPIFKPLATRTIVAPWRPSVRLRTTDWRPGLYVIKLTASSGWQSAIPLIVRSKTARDKVAIVAPVTTWQAYNRWGGYSLYFGPPGDRRSWAVSYDRPYSAPGAGTGNRVFSTAQTVVLAERLDVPLAYFTSIDIHRSGNLLRGADGLISAGHDEYWSRGMRRHVAQARARGTNLAFFGANTMYWRIRLEDRKTGPHRLQVGYRSDASLDPVAQRRPRLTTARWRDRPFPRPENSLIGMLYECYPVSADYRVVSPGWWGFRNTGVKRGTQFRSLVGTEADRVYPIGSTPRPLQILSYSRYSCGGVGTSSQSTYYTSRSGAGVFTAGTLSWQCALIRRCDTGANDARTKAFVRTVTRNVFKTFNRGPVGDRHPARDNVARFHLPRVNQVPAS